MTPEYAMKGQFSEKSNVFSFGVLTLEIAWKLWSEGNISELIDPMISSDLSCHREMLRCYHVGLLCVQNFVKDRPTMMVVASMLNSEIENFLHQNNHLSLMRKLCWITHSYKQAK
ncbi:hypothetical protein Goklo_006514 [Gossypium klotzschianum]|uniref:Serine-threonine/tyrosine-protein kinase catalytic domain-containing protein n=1 Tax=Gossypium klotzschianum TaxID=34286 RepID=A0A7J8VHV3_9ROSI|nr:hypothetical protein [Gossypium klotzschianum]